MNPFFSVVISLFNKENHIRSTVESVLNQKYDNFELIIVNDGSTDKSLEIINTINDNRIRIITTENKGASKSRNTGINAAKAKYIALLDGDDLWDNHYLVNMYNAISSYNDISVFATALAQKYDKKIVPVAYNFKQETLFKTHNYFKSSLKYSILSSSSIVFKKEIIENIGDFDSSIVSGQDTDMWIRIGLEYDIVFINEILAFYRYVPSSLSNTTFEASKKPTFSKYKALEKENTDLKKLLDINRYSLALMSKINNQNDAFNFYKSQLDIKNLNLLKRILINSPKWLLDILLWIKSLKKEKIYYKPL
jgi:glycosyltransferase involved in cell wall biosynthesis